MQKYQIEYLLILQNNKICVVLDCSSKYAGRSINKELLVGPEQTNQITDSLIRSRPGKVAFAADIEKMFFQVLVSKKHKSLFLEVRLWPVQEVDRS